MEEQKKGLNDVLCQTALLLTIFYFFKKKATLLLSYYSTVSHHTGTDQMSGAKAFELEASN